MSSQRVHLADGRLLGHFIHEKLTKILILNVYNLDPK